MNWFRLKTRIKCQGDLAADQGNWLCLQCGTYYYTGLYQLPSHLNDRPTSPGPSACQQPGEKSLAARTTSLITTFESPPSRAVPAMSAAVNSL